MSTSPPQTPRKGYSPFSNLLDLSQVERGADWSCWHLPVTDELINTHGVVHGGAIYSLADTCMGSAVYSDLAAGEYCVTVEIKISYFKPVTTGIMIGQAKILNRGRRLVTVEAEIKHDEQLVAKALGTFYVLKKSNSVGD